MNIPTYAEALERHETALDVFISRWEPVRHASDIKTFREDLAALIEYIQSEEKKQEKEERNLT